MPSTLTFTFPSSETVLWQSRAEALAFFESLQVDDAGLITPGVVKKASSVSYTNFTTYTENDTFTLNFDGTEHELAENATFEEVRTKLLSVSAGLNSLLISLRNAGILQS